MRDRFAAVTMTSNVRCDDIARDDLNLHALQLSERQPIQQSAARMTRSTVVMPSASMRIGPNATDFIFQSGRVAILDAQYSLGPGRLECYG